jgi:hypothetical protein
MKPVYTTTIPIMSSIDQDASKIKYNAVPGQLCGYKAPKVVILQTPEMSSGLEVAENDKPRRVCVWWYAGCAAHAVLKSEIESDANICSPECNMQTL